MKKLITLGSLLLIVSTSLLAEAIVERSTADAIDLRINFQGRYKLQPKTVKSKVYNKLQADEEGFTEEGVFPVKEYLSKNYLIAVPENSTPVLDILSISSAEVDGRELITAKKLITGKDGLSYFDYEASEQTLFADVKPVELVNHGRENGNRIYAIKFQPLYFTNNQAKIAENLRVRIRYTTAFQKQPALKGIKSGAGNLLNADFAATNKGFPKITLSPTFLDTKTTWVKVAVQEEGIYRVTGNQIAALGGIDISKIACSKIALYSSAGEPLPDNPNLPLSHGAKPAARKVIDLNNNGRLDGDDYIIFYGQTPVSWKRGSKVEHYYTNYSSTAYYWINPGIDGNGEGAVEMTALESNGLPSLQSINTFKRLFLKDVRNQYHYDDYEGVWFGKNIAGGESYSLDLPTEYLLDSARCQIKYYDPHGYNQGGIIEYYLNGSSTPLYTSIESNMTVRLPTASMNVTGNNVLRLKNTTSSSSKPFLGFEFFYDAKINAAGGSNSSFYATLGSLDKAVTNYRLNLENSTGKELFDITDPYNVKYSKLTNNFCDVSISKRDNYLFSLRAGDYLTPSEVALYDNRQESTLHSVINNYANNIDLLVIAPDEFYEYLSNDESGLISAHKETDPDFKNALVVKMSDINNEFGRGYQEPNATRNFLRYTADVLASKGDKKLKNVLLAGDGNNDYQNYLGVKSANYIYPSNPESNAFVGSDDFYAALYSNVSAMGHIGIGRFPVMSMRELRQAAEKTVEFMRNTNPGLAGQTALFLGDDEAYDFHYDGAGNHIMLTETELLPRVPHSIIQKKVYLTEYPSIIDPATQSMVKPGAAQALARSLNQGVRLFTYSGHGKPDQLAHEKALSVDVWGTVNNRDYFFMMGATCSFGVFDTYNSRGLAEQMMVAEKRGSIGLINNTRPCTSGANMSLFADVYTYLFNDTITVGEALKRGKRENPSSNSAGFMLLGDPALKIFKAKEIVKGPESLTVTTLKVDSIASEVEGLPTFNGKMLTAIYDAEKTVTYTRTFDNAVYTATYNLPGNLIVPANSRITNGHSYAKFVLPKDLNYGKSGAKVVFYGFNNQAEQVSGYVDSVSIQGGQAGNDSIPPELEVKFNGLDYQTGDPIGADPVIFAVMKDENGINVSGGIGHKMFFELDGEQIEVRNYFNYFENSYQQGFVEYQFFGLKPGMHTLKVDAWDTYNNRTLKTVEFKVVSTDEPGKDWIGNLLNYPNPIKNSGTRFTFNLNRPVDVLDYKITIYTINGRKIKVLDDVKVEPSSQNQTAFWDGKDADGDYPANGVYFYKVDAKFNYIDDSFKNSTKTVTKIGKLLFAR